MILIMVVEVMMVEVAGMVVVMKMKLRLLSRA